MKTLPEPSCASAAPTVRPIHFTGCELQTNAVPGLKSEGSARFLPKLKYSLGGSGARQRRQRWRAAGDAAVWPGRIRARAGRRDFETGRSRRSRSRWHFWARQPDGSRHRSIWLEGGASARSKIRSRMPSHSTLAFRARSSRFPTEIAQAARPSAWRQRTGKARRSTVARFPD